MEDAGLKPGATQDQEATCDPGLRRNSRSLVRRGGLGMTALLGYDKTPHSRGPAKNEGGCHTI